MILFVKLAGKDPYDSSLIKQPSQRGVYSLLEKKVSARVMLNILILHSFLDGLEENVSSQAQISKRA